MLRPFALLSLLGLATTAMTVAAAPTPQHHREHRLEDVQCRCLSFSTNAKPTVCSYLALHSLDWDTAYAFAVYNDLGIQFASKATVSKILSIPKPLPSSILLSLGGGKTNMPQSQRPLPSREPHQQQGRPEGPAASVIQVVCGLGDEVKHLGSDVHFSKPELHYVGVVLAGLTVFLIVWVMGEYFWTRWVLESVIGWISN